MNRHITVEMVVDLYNQNYTAKEIADLLGVSTSTVWYRMRNTGVPSRPAARPTAWQERYSEVDISVLVEDYNSGLSLLQLQEKYKIQASALRKYLLREGVNMRIASILKNDEHDKVHYHNIICHCHLHHGMGQRGEQRLVMEHRLDRILDRHEHVHHKNGDRRDNRLENLEIYMSPDHTRHHLEEARLKLKTRLQQDRSSSQNQEVLENDDLD